MTDRRRKPQSPDLDHETLLERLSLARHALVDAQRGLRPKSGLARSATAVIAEIDEFAFVLTGAENYFHSRPHGTPARQLRSSK
ncbi:hypothetical protein [Roseibium sediminicola]|uniref:Uncharacterized protein n=1 Tax=Roseibium sediminicola TaxID=2933272 RepID=A0ABT0GRS0_9HYPH|nr:hypothetical protein [Roseibium sp. CAU 1639]